MSTHDEIVAMIARLHELKELHRLPYANDMWWRIGDAISALERADEVTPEVRYAEEQA